MIIIFWLDTFNGVQIMFLRISLEIFMLKDLNAKPGFSASIL